MLLGQAGVQARDVIAVTSSERLVPTKKARRSTRPIRMNVKLAAQNGNSVVGFVLSISKGM
jgi:hypothetical protein